MSDEQQKIDRLLRRATRFLYAGLPLIIIAPILLIVFMKPGDFPGNTGQFGDTVGGLTAPFVNLLGMVMVFFALQAQTQANQIVQNQIDEQQKTKIKEDESRNVNHLFNTLKYSIDNFEYSTLNPWKFGKKASSKGSEAIYKLFHDFYCDYHGNEDDMRSNPKLTELISIFELCDLILKKINTSNIPDKEALRVLTIHQYQFRLMPRLSNVDTLERYKCKQCKTKHGLPQRMVALITSIDTSINSITVPIAQVHNQNIPTTMSNDKIKSNERFVRWQSVLREHTTTINNLFLVLSTAIVGYLLSLLTGTFNPTGIEKLLFTTGLLLSYLSIVLGIAVVFSRLKDYRATLKKIKTELTSPSLDELEPLKKAMNFFSKITRQLLTWQTITFLAGSIFLTLAFCIIYKAKLF